MEQKARSLLPASDLPALAYYMEEYAARRLTPDAFLTVLRDLLDTPQKVTVFAFRTYDKVLTILPRHALKDHNVYCGLDNT